MFAMQQNHLENALNSLTVWSRGWLKHPSWIIFFLLM
ncbi:hypothetical protein V1291_003111 [Nitrobacteraceae bacterium AZCC 1564]